MDNFIEELEKEYKNETREKNLLNSLKNSLDYAGQCLADNIIQDIKSEIKRKARAGDYNVKNGKNTISCDIETHARYMPDKDLDELLKDIEERKIDISDLCIRDYRYESLGIKLGWTNLRARFSVGQIIGAFMTLGLSLCHANEKVYEGNVKFDYLSIKSLNLVKSKLKEEKIIFEGFHIKVKNIYQDWSHDRYIDLGVFKDIDTEIPLKVFADDCRRPIKGEPLNMSLSIKCKVVF